MPIDLSKKGNFSPYFILVVIFTLINFFTSQNAVLGLILGIFWLVYSSFSLGKRLLPQKPACLQSALGLVLLQIIIIILSLIFFYLINFNDLSIALVFLIVSLLIIYFDYTAQEKRKSILKHIFKSILIFKTFVFSLKNIFKQSFLFAVYIILYLISFSYLFKYATKESILSPWDVLPKNFFLIFIFLNIILLIILLNKDKQNNIPFSFSPTYRLTVLSLHSFLIFSIALVVYKIGYGFDPFVHRAAENALSNLGYILPKPLYYIGQYTLVVFWENILFAKISLIDKLLTPLLAALTLPAIIYYSLINLFKDKKRILLLINYVLIFVIFLFFYTVPQSLANLFLLTLIFLSIPYLNKKIPYYFWLIALATLFIHPLSGIPAFIYLGYLTLRYYNFKILKIIYLILSSICLPIFFYLISFISPNFNIQFNLSNITNIFNIFPVPNYFPFYSIYHLIYLYKFNLLILLILILIAGIYYLYKKNKKEVLCTSLTISFILLINLILLSAIKFTSVIHYEQAEFAKRLVYIIFLFILPIILSGIYFIGGRIYEFKKGKTILILLTVLISVMTLYISYPHVDAFEKNRGYSVSEYDIQAVRYIEEDAKDEGYIVLANQSTSAAALQEFGFKKYYNNLFYYPIPTSSPLYDIYLKMVYDQPKKEYIQKARDLTGVNTIYFVINDYWLDSKKRIEEAREIINYVENANDKVWVFRFEL